MKKKIAFATMLIFCTFLLPLMSTGLLKTNSHEINLAGVNSLTEEEELAGIKWFDYKKHKNSKGYLCCKPKKGKKCGWQVACPGYPPPGLPSVE